MEKKNPIEEAERYLNNAKTILKEKAVLDPATGAYTDSKYVKLAGHALWTGAIIALCYALKIERKKNQRLDIKDFQEAASKRNRKFLVMLNDQYAIAHLSMGYDGVKQKKVCDCGIELTRNMIDWCKENGPKL